MTLPYWRYWESELDLDQAELAMEKYMADMADYKGAPSFERLELACMPYPEYLRSEHWRMVRLRALCRAGYQCRVCETGRQLNVHHLSYARRGREAESDLVVLCQTCHSVMHRLLDHAKERGVDLGGVNFILMTHPWRLRKLRQEIEP